jgi:hypothetical protein
MPYVASPKTAGKAAVFEWVIHMIAGIVFARVVTYPGLAIHVWNTGVARFVTVVTGWLNRVRLSLQRRGTAFRNGWMRGVATGPFCRALSKRWDCKNEQSRKS